MTAQYKAGDNIVSWCTKCKLVLDHTVVALVDDFPKKVKCNTCSGRHIFRAKEPVKKEKTAKSPRKPKITPYEAFRAELSEEALSHVKKYVIKGNFRKDQVIEHARFGIGLVSSVVQKTRIEVLFEEGEKLLIQNHR